MKPSKQAKHKRLDRATMKLSQATSSNATRTVEVNGKEFEVPAVFVCPITLQVMRQPLVNKRGMNFERAAILSWLEKGTGHCPLTRLPMKPSDLIPNRGLEVRIQVWKKQNGLDKDEEDDSEVDCDDRLLGILSIPNTKMAQVLARRNMPQTPVPTSAIQSSHGATSAARRRERERRKLFLSRVLAEVSDGLDDM